MADDYADKLDIIETASFYESRWGDKFKEQQTARTSNLRSQTIKSLGDVIYWVSAAESAFTAFFYQQQGRNTDALLASANLGAIIIGMTSRTVLANRVLKTFTALLGASVAGSTALGVLVVGSAVVEAVLTARSIFEGSLGPGSLQMFKKRLEELQKSPFYESEYDLLKFARTILES